MLKISKKINFPMHGRNDIVFAHQNKAKGFAERLFLPNNGPGDNRDWKENVEEINDNIFNEVLDHFIPGCTVTNVPTF